MKNIPKKIWLTTGLDNDDEVRDFKELTEVSWCEEQVNDKDIPYVRCGTKIYGIAKEYRTESSFNNGYSADISLFATEEDRDKEYEKIKPYIGGSFSAFKFQSELKRERNKDSRQIKKDMDIKQAISFDGRNINDIFRLPCVQKVGKEENGKTYVILYPHYTDGRLIAQVGDVFVQYATDKWQVFGKEAYDKIR